MKIYNYNESGLFVGTSFADESPLEPGVFLMPAFSTELAPPDTVANKKLFFDGAKWLELDDYTASTACEIDPDTQVFIQPHVFQLAERPNERFVVAELPHEAFYKPKWSGTEWVESLTQEEIDAIEAAVLRNAPISNEDLKQKLHDTELLSADANETVQGLLELLIEMEII